MFEVQPVRSRELQEQIARDKQVVAAGGAQLAATTTGAAALVAAE